MQMQFPALAQRRHLIPGLVHATSADALNGDSLENNVFREIKRNRLGSKTKERDSSAPPHDVESSSDSAGMARHLKHDIHAQATGLLHDYGARVLFRRIN